MSLTASLWTSVSGLLAHGQKMNTVGNNISNVNTVGYKAQRMDFQDFVYQYTGTAAGMGQVGRGTSIGIIMNDFMQGSLETTTSATDIAITGNGFFKVRPLTSNESFYTRAGNFTFNRDGFLVDPHGYVLQGWMIDRTNQGGQISSDMRNSSGIVGSGSPVDIRLDTFTCPPRHTTNLSLPVNLRRTEQASASDNSRDIENPFFALLQTWDANITPPIGSNMYDHQATIEVFDEGGSLHKLTIYFDRVSDNNQGQGIYGYSQGESYWEFVITMDPSQDNRDFSSVFDPTGTTPTTPNVPPELRGLLGAGVMTFDSSGVMKNMSMFVPAPSDPTTGALADQWWGNDPSGNSNPNTGATRQVVDLSKWIPAPINSDGFPMIAPGFSGSPGVQSPYFWDANKIGGAGYDFTRPNPSIADRMIAIDLGMRISNSQWNFTATPTAPWPPAWAQVALGAQGTNAYVPGVIAPAVTTTAANLASGNFLTQFNNFRASAISGIEGRVAPPLDTDDAIAYATAYVDNYLIAVDGGANHTTAAAAAANAAIAAARTNAANATPPRTISNGAATSAAAAAANFAAGAIDIFNDAIDNARNDLVTALTATAPPGPGLDSATAAVFAESYVKTLTTGILTTTRPVTPAAVTAPNGPAAAANTAATAAAVGAAGNLPVNGNGVPFMPSGGTTVGTTIVPVWDGSQIPGSIPETNSTDQQMSLYLVHDPDRLGTPSQPQWYYIESATKPAIGQSFGGVTIGTNATIGPAIPLVRPPADSPLRELPPELIVDPNSGLPTAAMIGVNKFAVNGSGSMGVRQPNSTTNFGNSSFEHSGKRQDGYTFGDLRFVNVDNNGVLSATYSNGVTLQLFQITLHDFPSLQNLRREGGNLYSETRESGQPSTGAPGSGVFGTTRGYSLEQSNVDLSREFVNMITTQRGFQANSKNITTVDTMLEVVINMKR